MIKGPHSVHLINVIIPVQAHCWTDGRGRPFMHDMSISRFFTEIAMSSLNNASVTRSTSVKKESKQAAQQQQNGAPRHVSTPKALPPKPLR